MYGVVLWSDQSKNRAVIWCEDHGDLAFYKGEEIVDSWMDPGDLVRFDLRDDKQMRIASNLALVASDEYPTLARYLKETGGAQGPDATETTAISVERSSARIVPFAPATCDAVSPDQQSNRKSV